MRCFKNKMCVYDIFLSKYASSLTEEFAMLYFSYPQHIANVSHTQYVIKYFLCILFACGSIGIHASRAGILP